MTAVWYHLWLPLSYRSPRRKPQKFGKLTWAKPQSEARLHSKLHLFPLFQKNGKTSCSFCPCTGATWDFLKAPSFFLNPSLGWISWWCNTQMPSASGRRINPIAQIRNNHPAKNKPIPKTFFSGCFRLSFHLLLLLPPPCCFFSRPGLIHLQCRHSTSVFQAK